MSKAYIPLNIESEAYTQHIASNVIHTILNLTPEVPDRASDDYRRFITSYIFIASNERKMIFRNENDDVFSDQGGAFMNHLDSCYNLLKLYQQSTPNEIETIGNIYDTFTKGLNISRLSKAYKDTLTGDGEAEVNINDIFTSTIDMPLLVTKRNLAYNKIKHPNEQREYPTGSCPTSFVHFYTGLNELQARIKLNAQPGEISLLGFLEFEKLDNKNWLHDITIPNEEITSEYDELVEYITEKYLIK